MPEEQLAFARKASGLVRGLSLFDAFGIGIMTIMPIYGIWYSLQVGVGLFPGGNLLIAIALTFILCGLSAPIVWGVLSASMPRSGGEYIFNSRIIHPAIAMGASFANMIAITYWNIFIATWIASPALAILAQYMGWTGLANFVAGTFGIVLLGTLTCVGAFLCVAFGINIYRQIQRVMAIVAIGGCIVLAITLSLTTKAGFINHWNSAAAKYHSLTYHDFIAAAGSAAGTAMPRTWSWGDTVGAMTGIFMLTVYTYFIVYASGEVKRPDTTMLKAQWLAMMIPLGLAFWTFAAIYRMADFSFVSAAAYNDLFGGVKGYNFPFSTSYMTLSWLASGSSGFVAFVASITFLLGSFMVITVDVLLLPRAMFAWGMDRMGPKWFTDISARWGTPVKTMAFLTVVQIVLIVAYELWFSSQLTGLVAAGMQLVSVFGITAISAILFAYRKKVRGIWDASPYKNWKIAGVPLITIAGLVYLAFIVILLYYAFFDPQTRDINGTKTIVFVCAWAAGVSWYFYWRRRSAKVGVDVSVTYGELPPE
jgi:APA family basic amino acid/polyamine antiporter